MVWDHSCKSNELIHASLDMFHVFVTCFQQVVLNFMRPYEFIPRHSDDNTPLGGYSPVIVIGTNHGTPVLLADCEANGVGCIHHSI